MTDVFKDLPRLTWRGIQVPVLERNVSFEQELARHKYVYRDNEYLESLGRHNWRFEYTIPFREDITKGPYKNLYVATFSTFLQACRDRSEGELQDPVLGTYTARCESVSVRTDVNRRDGEDMQVVFVDSPSVDDIEATGATASGLVGATAQARNLGDQIARVPIPPSDIDEFRNGIDILDQIAGIGARALAYVDQIDAAFAKYEAKIDKLVGVLEDAGDRISSPENMPLIRSALRLKDTVQRAQFKSATMGKTIVSEVTTSDSTVTSLANYYKMTVADFLLINTRLPMPLVPAGSLVFYFQRS
jgi:hypothetical protein